MNSLRKGVGVTVYPVGIFSEAMLDRIQSGVVVLNAEGTVQYLNHYCANVLKADPIVWIGRNASELFPELDMQLVKQVMKDSISIPVKEMFLQIEGVQLVLELEISPLTVLGQTVGSLITFQDRTFAAHIQQDIVQAEKMATIGSMAAGTVHEIRNPLTTVKGFLQLFEKDIQKLSGMGVIQRGFSEKVKSVFPLLFSEIKKIEQILSDFLLISQPQSLRYKVIRINDFLNTVVPKLQERAMKENAAIICEYPRRNVKFFGDPDEVSSVLGHLLENALEALEDRAGEIHVSADISEDFIVLTVSDNGKGMPEEIIHSAFDPFVTTKEERPGLGLSICRQIVTRMGGSISLTSRLGEGTSVSVRIPFLNEDVLSLDELRPMMKEAALH